MTDRGVTETLGFVLVFALVVGTIGMVYATGFSGLEGAQHAERVSNVERAFDVLADNLEDLHRDGTPSRATEVKLAGGSLGVGEPVTIEVYAENDSEPSDNATHSVTLEPVVYEDDGGSSIVYVSGAVLRSQRDGVVMLAKPGWVVGTERTVIPLVDTYGSGGGIGGDGAVLVVAERGTRTLRGPFEVNGGATARVNVTVTSPRVDVWKRYFEDEGFVALDDDTDDGNVTYQFETESLYVSRTGVEVTFNR